MEAPSLPRCQAGGRRGHAGAHAGDEERLTRFDSPTSPQLSTMALSWHPSGGSCSRIGTPPAQCCRALVESGIQQPVRCALTSAGTVVQKPAVPAAITSHAVLLALYWNTTCAESVCTTVVRAIA